MLRLGYNIEQKKQIIANYCQREAIKKVYFFSPERFMFTINEEHESIEYADIIMYKYFYRLLKEIDANSLIVVNECLRTQNRNDLTFNCLRQYLNQTSHRIIFQYLPQIDTFDDFMTLYDFDTKTKYKMQKFQKSMLGEIDLKVKQIDISISPISINVSPKTLQQYETKKEKLFAEIGLKDPHTIPRNLYLLGGKEKLKLIDENKKYIGRNNRFKLPNLATYNDKSFTDTDSIIFELPHNFINLSDYLCLSNTEKVQVLSTDLKVDKWYIERYTDWAKRIQDGYSNLQ